MRINTNVASLNAQRTLGNTGAAAAKTIGRLSSGFRINSASDDAAGLGIANKLRADVRSMGQAARNAEQANSLLQIAEGATGTVQNILERMKELATQAGSDTVDTDGRGRINAEFTALRSELNRTVETTKFQGTSLLKGTIAVEGRDAADATSTGTAALAANDGITSATVADSATADGDFRVYKDGTNVLLQQSVNGSWDTVDTKTAGGTLEFGGISIVLAADIAEVPVEAGALEFSVTAAVTAQDAVEGTSQSFLVSSSGQYTDNDAIELKAINLASSTLGIDSDNLSSLEAARTALSNIDDALAKVATTLGDIGAAQNRIQYATQNVKTAIENFSAAESTIRDADMASEMSTFTKQQILQQAGVAMLAQANSAPQQILRLLQ